MFVGVISWIGFLTENDPRKHLSNTNPLRSQTSAFLALSASSHYLLPGGVLPFRIHPSGLIPRSFQMKSCPQCKFTFPDDVHVCDFDHSELIPVTDTSRPRQQSALAKRNRRAARSRVALILIAIAGVAASALMVGYYDSVNQSGAELAAVPNPQSQTLISPHKTPAEKIEPAKLDPAPKTRFISTQRRIDVRHNRASASGESRTQPSSNTRASEARIATVARSTRKSRQSTTNTRIHSNAGSERADARESTFDRSKSKVVAVLKKTGSILSKPFRL